MDFKKYIEEDAILNITDICVFLYKEEHVLGFYKNTTDFQKGITTLTKSLLINSILGGSEYKINNTENCLEIDSIHTKQGYGPLLYLLLMTGSNNNGVMPNSDPTLISNEAKIVWKNFYNGKGKDLVTKNPLKKKYHKELYLNFKYNNIKQLNIKKGLSNHKKAIGEDPYNKKINMLLDAFDDFIKIKMHSMYK